MRATIVLSIFLALFLSCESPKKKQTKYYDLKYFNLKGKIKSFSEERVLLDCGKNNDWSMFDEFRTTYYIYNFDKFGMLDSVTNKNASYYTIPPNRFNIEHKKNSLKIIHKSPKIIFLRAYEIKDDSLFTSNYIKIDDNGSNNVHLERFNLNKFKKRNKKFVLAQESEGDNDKDMHTSRFRVETNKDGYESKLFLIGYKNSETPLYLVEYLEFDKKGNWIKRKFRDINEKKYEKCFTEYRKIEYY